ncbi:MAG: glycyl-radical enzyme activating protein, partial [Parasporobacterium sp.]|nr:glycyl-radical enzyme activating protein [Parasporobacterium sp.]
VLPYTDVFLYDIKLMDPGEHKRFTGADNKLILENLVRLSRDGAGIYIRIPVIRGVNARDDFFEQTADFLIRNRIAVRQISLLPYHDYGKSKYENLQRKYEEEKMAVPEREKMEHFRDLLAARGFSHTLIGG